MRVLVDKATSDRWRRSRERWASLSDVVPILHTRPRHRSRARAGVPLDSDVPSGKRADPDLSQSGGQGAPKLGTSLGTLNQQISG